MEWIGLSSVLVALCANLVGGIVGAVKFIQCLNNRFADLKASHTADLAEHDKKDEARQLEVVQRLTALETTSRFAARARRAQHVG